MDRLVRMNAAANTTGAGNTNKGSGGNAFAKPLVGLMIFVGVMIGLYYLYKFLYGSNKSMGSVTILSGNKSATETVPDTDSGKQAVARTNLSGIADGGQYTVSFWVYVASAKSMTNNKLVHFMEISDKRFSTDTAASKRTLVFVGMNPLNGTLVVRQSTDEPSEQLKDSAGAPTLGQTGFPNGYSLSNLIDNYAGPAGASYKEDDRCDIINGIEYQRWVLITVVGNGRTLDVYLDGKLARSCVYKANFALGNNAGQGQCYFGLDNGGNFKGYFASGNYYNYALTPDAVWANYQQGPGGQFSITDWFKNLFNIDVTFGTSSGLNTPSS